MLTQTYGNQLPVIIKIDEGAVDMISGSELVESDSGLVADDTEIVDETNKQPRKVILCSGKVYFDILTEINEKKINNLEVIQLGKR